MVSKELLEEMSRKTSKKDRKNWRNIDRDYNRKPKKQELMEEEDILLV